MAQPPALSHLSDSPVFNTKAVARETGVPVDEAVMAGAHG